MDESEYGVRPVPASMPAMRGLFVGGCVERGIGSSFRARAHAHTSGDYRGWVCVRSPQRLGTPEKPSRLMWHEYAHITSGHGHDDAWRLAMRGLGQPIPARYVKKRRGPKALGYVPMFRCPCTEGHGGSPIDPNQCSVYSSIERICAFCARGTHH